MCDLGWWWLIVFVMRFDIVHLIDVFRESVSFYGGLLVERLPRQINYRGRFSVGIAFKSTALLEGHHGIIEAVCKLVYL